MLFLCSQNRLRSPTAETVLADWPGVECTSAGTNRGADTPLSQELVEWAEIIFCMEKAHVNRLRLKFTEALREKRVVCLHIADLYTFMDPDLLEELRAKLASHVSLPEEA